MCCFRYGSFRLIDIPGLREIMPVTMEMFVDHVKQSSAAGAERLKKEWIPECCQIIDSKRDDIEAWMPMDDPVSITILHSRTDFNNTCV